MRCKFPENGCLDRYYSSRKGVFMCRLSEWKKKSAVCPYDSRITSKNKSKKTLDKLGQKTLETKQ